MSKIKKPQEKICSHCNPKTYLKFNFSFITQETGEPTDKDIKKFFEKMKMMSSEPYMTLVAKFLGRKNSFIEVVSYNELSWTSGKKEIPSEYLKYFPLETNEKLYIFRVSVESRRPARIIGIIKNTIFYVLYLDWNGELYKHE